MRRVHDHAQAIGKSSETGHRKGNSRYQLRDDTRLYSWHIRQGNKDVEPINPRRMLLNSDAAGKNKLSKEDLVQLLSLKEQEQQQLFGCAAKIKLKHVGNKVWLRGLIELSNICEKDCYYCGIRRSNNHTHRYSISHDEVMPTVKSAYEKGYGSVAIQSGEVTSRAFIDKIDKIVREAKQVSGGELGITISCGEQSEETYRRWFESGADRYLLRIETSSEELYGRLHPNDEMHNYGKRVHALEILRKTGYQVGTGVMIGLPFKQKKCWRTICSL